MATFIITNRRGQRFEVLVDAADLPLLRAHRWHVLKMGTTWHVKRTGPRVDGRQRTIYLHRELLGAGPEDIADHVNGNGLDNRRANLRKATPQQNAVNRATNRNNTSGTRGVSAMPYGRWKAHIAHQRKHIHLGCFGTKEEAAAARTAAERLLWGEFAPTLCRGA